MKIVTIANSFHVIVGTTPTWTSVVFFARRLHHVSSLQNRVQQDLRRGVEPEVTFRCLLIDANENFAKVSQVVYASVPIFHGPG